MAEQDNRSVMESIRRAMLAGRQSDNFSMEHNPDWKYNKMYGDIFDKTEPGDDNYLMLPESPTRRYHFGNDDQYAQNGPFTGQRTAPEMPSARDVIIMERSNDPRVKEMFGDAFGTEALDRSNRNRYGVRSPDYIPNPRPRPSAAPLGPGEDEYQGDQSGMSPESYKTDSEPRPEEAYSYIPGLKERVAEHVYGPGPARETKGDRQDGTRFDRDFEDVGGDQRANIQDYRLRAIENMMQRGGQAQQPPESMEQPMEQSPQMSSQGLDDMLQRHFQEMRQQQLSEDPELSEFDRRRHR